MKIKTLGASLALLLASQAHCLSNKLELTHIAGIDYQTMDKPGEIKDHRPHQTKLTYKASHGINFGQTAFKFSLDQNRSTYNTRKFNVNIDTQLLLSTKTLIDVNFDNTPVKDILLTAEIKTKTDNQNFFQKAQSSFSNSLLFKSVILLGTSDTLFKTKGFSKYSCGLGPQAFK